MAPKLLSGLVRGRSVNVTNDIGIPRITTNIKKHQICCVNSKWLSVDSNLLQTNITDVSLGLIKNQNGL